MLGSGAERRVVVSTAMVLRLRILELHGRLRSITLFYLDTREVMDAVHFTRRAGCLIGSALAGASHDQGRGQPTATLLHVGEAILEAYENVSGSKINLRTVNIWRQRLPRAIRAFHILLELPMTGPLIILPAFE